MYSLAAITAAYSATNEEYELDTYSAVVNESYKNNEMSETEFFNHVTKCIKEGQYNVVENLVNGPRRLSQNNLHEAIQVAYDSKHTDIMNMLLLDARTDPAFVTEFTLLNKVPLKNCLSMPQSHLQVLPKESNVKVGSPPIAGWERILAGGLSFFVPGYYPLPPASIFSIIDPYNAKAKNIDNGDGSGKFFSDDDINAIRQRHFDFMNNVYGLDFSTGFHDPVSDGYVLPQAVLYQLCNIAPPGYTVTLDTAHPERQGSWTVFEVGCVVVATTNGVYPGGARAGLPCRAGDILTNSYIHFVFPGKDWKKPQNIEVLNIFSIAPNRANGNSFGLQDLLAQMKVTSDSVTYSRDGDMMDCTSRRRLLDGTWELLSRTTFYFPLPL